MVPPCWFGLARWPVVLSLGLGACTAATVAGAAGATAMALADEETGISPKQYLSNNCKADSVGRPPGPLPELGSGVTPVRLAKISDQRPHGDTVVMVESTGEQMSNLMLGLTGDDAAFEDLSHPGKYPKVLSPPLAETAISDLSLLLALRGLSLAFDSEGTASETPAAAELDVILVRSLVAVKEGGVFSKDEVAGVAEVYLSLWAPGDRSIWHQSVSGTAKRRVYGAETKDYAMAFSEGWCDLIQKVAAAWDSAGVPAAVVGETVER